MLGDGQIWNTGAYGRVSIEGMLTELVPLHTIIKPNKFGPFPRVFGVAGLHCHRVLSIEKINGANILTDQRVLLETPYWMAPEVIEMSGVLVPLLTSGERWLHRD
ncbi:hypothetical protein NC652_019943 [Populus alba x Populus x berolinensis]|nr:hypothetical protein NC652_019943 [Populus alba x Populus x berolinensis]